jgi:hypothetical protein
MILLSFFLFLISFSSFLRFFIAPKVICDEDAEELEQPEEIKYEDKYWDKFRDTVNEHAVSNVEEAQKREEMTEELRRLEQDLEDFGDIVAEEKRAEMQVKLMKMDPATEARKFLVAQRLEQLLSCILFETTPVGNVIMLYNAKKEAFEYYSDCMIPYRYLDAACRKYVATFCCKPLYIDMNEELRKSEAKTMLLRESKAKEKEDANANVKDTGKKNVFAKLKTYNKDSTRGGAPPKNSLPSAQKIEESAPFVAKERTNKFLFLGKTVNFSTAKKTVPTTKKVSFADFKKMSQK